MILTNKKIFSIVTFIILIKLIWMSFNQAIVEEAYYWNYAIHLDFGYLDHPPMVANMIAISRFLFGDNEWAIRIPAFLCWLGTAGFMYRLSELMEEGTGYCALFLMSILPFFFLQSMFMTPDLPLMLFWSATLYYCYRAIVLGQTHLFYVASITLGLGLLSKYTIFLLVPATLILITIVPAYRKWWRSKELYLGGVLALLIFSPVIYWNATHEWASFAFQSTTRIQDTRQFCSHLFFLYILFFIFPGGIYGLWLLLKKKEIKTYESFIKVYTLTPLAIFAVISIHNQIKFNWLGPVFLAFIPWLSAWLKSGQYPKHLFNVLLGLLPAYVIAMMMMISAQPPLLYQKLFFKFFDWQGLAIELNHIANQYEKEFKVAPRFLALDKYNINSEMVFYQQKALEKNLIQKKYPVLGQHVLNYPSLMYKFWDESSHHHGEKVILLSWHEEYLNAPNLSQFLKFESPRQKIFTHDPLRQYQLLPMYYQIAELL